MKQDTPSADGLTPAPAVQAKPIDQQEQAMSTPADFDVWSSDEEYFYELDDFIGMKLEDLEPGHVVYRGLQVMRDAGHFAPSPTDLLSEHMSEQAWEEAGEFAEDWPDVPNAKWAELDSLIHEWLNKNVPVTFWTVRNVEKVEITEELLAEWRAPATSALPAPCNAQAVPPVGCAEAQQQDKPEPGAQAKVQPEAAAWRNAVFEAGWRLASKWALRDDLYADAGSPAYIRDREAVLSQLESLVAATPAAQGVPDTAMEVLREKRDLVKQVLIAAQDWRCATLPSYEGPNGLPLALRDRMRSLVYELAGIPPEPITSASDAAPAGQNGGER